MAESYSINGTNVSTYMSYVQTLDGLIGAPPMRQADYTVPGRTGVIAAKPWAGPRPIVIGGIVTGADRTEYQTNLRALANLCFNGGDTITVKRVLNTSATTTLTSVATARYVNGLDRVDELAHHTGRVAIEFSLLDGFFYDESFTDLQSTTDAKFTIQVPGDAPTTQVRVRFGNGSDTQRLTNDTTGDYIQYTGSTSTNVLVDVANFTATQGSNNVIGNTRSGTASYYWMRLVPGRNDFTRTGNGSVRVLYKAAYL
jgi:hypothetical protein